MIELIKTNDFHEELCPVCVNEFIKLIGADKLADEIYDLHDTRNTNFALCEDHTTYDLKHELEKARKLTKEFVKTISLEQALFGEGNKNDK